MTVSVANKLIQDGGSLSELARLVLSFIDGGVQWLAWAANDTSFNYNFPDETALVAQVQQGLHNSPLTLLPNLQLLISPIKLMTFSIGDLRTVAKADSGDQDPATVARLNSILSAHDVQTQADLAAVRSFLSNLGIAAAPVFQSLGLNDMIALSELIALPQPQGGDPEIQSDAARFALQQARTPEEFCDYYRAYMALKTKLQTAGTSPQQQTAQATAAVQTLLPLMFGALGGPQVDGLVPPAEVAVAVSDWLRQGRRLGFSRPSEGACRIIDSTAFTDETGAAAQHILNHYLADAQSFLVANDPKTDRISQDGLSCVLPAQSGNLYAELQLSPGGCITLRQFRRIPPPNESE
jgi:hypothetical protein